ncbi:ribosome hibernation-promoting factor, HPF/YfiA family [Herbiconiux flava]|uniref:Ribosome hibernation promoting factor n=1 Tax=Herbiconiux flava TaxID=881268 RepID=A0A852SUB2_9MICO|nr:ribosome-associated translation inhibitor RaiA [Herbiconiux flava]NYD72315.1 ribosomal subunit interface protein [Herbiconiux flava]GLK17722.1 ribosomal subunit interface protein [Herbiconiux flava]
MEVNITGRNLGITDRFREYASEKAEKVAHLADKALALEIKVSRHNSANGTQSGDDRVELTLIGPGPLVRAECAASDKYAAFDLALAKLMQRVRRAKDRKKVHRGQHRPVSVHEATTGAFTALDVEPASADVLVGVPSSRSDDEAVSSSAASPADAEDDYCPVVIRKKVYGAAPMTVDDALYHMELVGHDFYLFIDSETDRPSVVYRRKGWDYGVIGLDENAAAFAEIASETVGAASR